MLYNCSMDTNNDKKKFSEFIKRFKTPLIATVSAVTVGVLVVPPILGMTAMGNNFFTSALNINAPALPDANPTANAVVTLTSAPLPTIEVSVSKEPTSAYTLLQQGVEDDSVMLLQERLMALDFMDSDEPSTSYGAATAAAVSRFQNVHHMVETGIADEITQKLLFSENAKTYSLSKTSKGNDIRLLQQQLADLGYYAEKQNGYFGAATEAALMEFQRINALEVTGVADHETLDLIYSPFAQFHPDYVPTPSPTPKPTPTKSPTPKPTKSPTPKPTKSPTPTPKPTKTPKATATVKPTASSKPTATPKATPTIKPTKSPTPKPTEAPTNTPKPTEAPSYSPNVSSLIKVAEAQLGKPYIYSTEGPDSFDCSGLVYYCLKQIGVSTRRLSASGFSQVESWTKVVGMDNLEKGDLIFFYDPGTKRIGHVGIWYGNNKYLHASSTAGKVIITTCGEWARTNFAWGRRIF